MSKAPQTEHEPSDRWVSEADTIVLNSTSSLRRFRESLLLPQHLPARYVSVDSSVFPDSDVAFEARLNELYADCACAQGSLAVTAAGAMVVTRQLRSPRALTRGLAFRHVAILGIAGVAGKVGGLAANRLRLLRMTSALSHEPTS